MREEITFTWSGQGHTKTALDPWLDKPASAEVCGFGCAALSSTAPPVTSQQWVSLAETPRVGQEMPLRVWRPFRGALRDLVWVAYPPLAEKSGIETTWFDAPAALTTGRLARCLMAGVLSHVEPEPHWLPGAWLRVSVEDIVAVPDMASRFSPRSTGRPIPPGIEPGSQRLRDCRQDGFHFVEFSAEGDLQEWVVWQRHGDGAAVVLGGERIFDDDNICAGHRPLSSENLQFPECCQRQAQEV